MSNAIVGIDRLQLAAVDLVLATPALPMQRPPAGISAHGWPGHRRTAARPPRPLAGGLGGALISPSLWVTGIRRPPATSTASWGLLSPLAAVGHWRHGSALFTVPLGIGSSSSRGSEPPGAWRRLNRLSLAMVRSIIVSNRPVLRRSSGRGRHCHRLSVSHPSGTPTECTVNAWEAGNSRKSARMRGVQSQAGSMLRKR